MTEQTDKTILTLTAEIVAAHVGHNRVIPGDLPELIQRVHQALNGLGKEAVETEVTTEAKPAVSLRSSVKPDYIVCLEDGKKLTMLKRYLQTRYGMTPQQYRQKWKLPADYPMVAPNYADRRRELAKAIGLGRKPKVVVPAAPAKRGRKPKAAS
jgi:predicted transcriptional regulator